MHAFDNFTSFSKAARFIEDWIRTKKNNPTDFANDFSEKKHRLFSYYLINELASGQTDLQNLYKTIRKKVKRQSLRKGIGYKQVPDFFGDTRKNI